MDLLRSPFRFGTILSVLSFLAGTLFSDAIDGLYDVYLGSSLSGVVNRLILGCVLAAILFVALRLVAPPRSLPVPVHYRRPRPRRGLVFLLGREAPCRKAVAHHGPTLEVLWLVCSEQTAQLAYALKDEYRGAKFETRLMFVNDVNSPIDYRNLVASIYKRLPRGWRADDVIADYLGMTAHASVGMILAWIKYRFPLQYVRPVFDDQLNPVGVGEPMEIVLIETPTGEPPKPPAAPTPAPSTSS